MVIWEMYVILRPCMMALSDHAIFSNLGGFELNNLISILDIEDNEPQIIQHSSYYDIDSFKKVISNHNNIFSVLSLNIQSINAKFSEIETFVEELHNVQFKFNVICLQECWIRDQTDACTFQIPGYDCVAQGKSSSERGGLITYVDNLFQYEVRQSINEYELWEGQIIQVKGGCLRNEIIVGNIYRPPRTLREQTKQFINEFTSLVQALDNTNLNIVLAGDYNLNLLKINESEICCEFFDLLTSQSLFPHITLPTRLTNGGGTLIDNLFCKMNKSIKKNTAGILLNQLSDHLPCFTLLETDIVHNSKTKFTRIFKQNDDVIQQIKNEMNSSELHKKLDTSQTANPNASYNVILEVIETARKKHMTGKFIKFNKYKHKKSKWITYGILKSIRFRDNLYKKLKLTNPVLREYEILYINLQTYNKILKRSIRVAKQLFLESTFNRYKSDIRNTWKTINEILSRHHKTSCFPKSLNINGNEITNQLHIATEVNVFFFTNIGLNLSNNIAYSGEKDCDYYLKDNLNCKFALNKVDEQNVSKTIDNLPNKASCGFDNISTIFLKQIAPTIIKPLTLLINQVFNTGIFPERLKLAKVTPVFKKGDSNLINNYRPISLLPVISKVLEKIIANQLSKYFEDNKLFHDNQYGFRTGLSTEYATIELTDRIISNMDRNEIPFSIFLDLSKAFDTLDHTILLKKLKHYGINGKALQLCESYLTNRTQYVEINGVKSGALPITTGVLPGSIIGPLLFIIYINDFSLASHVFTFISYADDTTLFSTLNNFTNTPNIDQNCLINEELIKINEWL